MTALGVAVGQCLWAAVTSAGLLSLLLASQWLFDLVKWCGAAYLVVLGLQFLRRAWRARTGAPTLDEVSDCRPLAGPTAFRQGLISNLGNPKMAIFFASLLPQFIPADMPPAPALLMLGALFALMTLGWLTHYAALFASAGGWFDRPPVRRIIDGGSGLLLVGFGVRLALDQD